MAISISAVTEPGDEVIIIAPFFPEYKVWIGTAGCTCVEVPAHVPDFQLDIDALAQAIGPKTAAIILNSPNNPVGAVYSRENLEAFAALLARKEEELGRKLYVISDEPYREITYGARFPTCRACGRAPSCATRTRSRCRCRASASGICTCPT
mgnify:CR=1 FL=1